MENTPGGQPQPMPPHHPNNPNIVYLQPGQQAVYVQPGQQTPTQVASGWASYPVGFPLQPSKAPSSGLRIAAGILGIVLGAWNLLMFFVLMAQDYAPSTPLLGWMNFLHLVGTLAVFTLGILLIVKHRRRAGPVPAMFLAAVLFLVIIDFPVGQVNWVPRLAVFTLVAGLPAAILAFLALNSESGVPRRQ